MKFAIFGCKKGSSRRSRYERKRTMANSRQARKRVRQAGKRTERNKSRLSRVRTYIKNVESAINEGDRDAAVAAISALQPEIMRGVTKGVLHKNTASRKLSRLSKRVQAL